MSVKQYPIYKAVYDLLVLTIQINEHLPGGLKATLGGSLMQSAISLNDIIIKVNREPVKYRFKFQLLDAIESMQFVARAGHECKAISNTKYVALASLTESIHRQANAWTGGHKGV